MHAPPCWRALHDSLQYASVSIKTLGRFCVHQRNGTLLPWQGGGAGSTKLMHAFGLLLTHRDQFVSHTDIQMVTECASKRLHFMSTAVGTMVKHWGIGAALEHTWRGLRLRSHPTWHTDTDMLVLTYTCAQQQQQDGQQQQALALLEQAAELCNGSYLLGYEPAPDYEVPQQSHHWLAYQKQVLHDLLHLLMAHPRIPGRLTLADHSVQRLLKLGFSNAADYRLAAELYLCLDRPRLAALYEQKARKTPY